MIGTRQRSYVQLPHLCSKPRQTAVNSRDTCSITTCRHPDDRGRTETPSQVEGEWVAGAGLAPERTRVNVQSNVARQGVSTLSRDRIVD